MTPKLYPLDVPWQISPSVPLLSFAVKNFTGMNHGYVTFDAVLGEVTELSRKYGHHKQVAVVLEQVIWSKFYPEFSTEDSERLNSYDWDDIPEFRDEEGSLKGHERRFHDQWNTTGRCPRPSAYLVAGSDLLRRLGFSDDSFKHYLFVGDDYNVEVVARSMTWEIIDPPTAAPI
jgi:hypothetical protein